MATIKYFHGATELTRIGHDGSPYTSARHFTGLLPDGRRVQVERVIEYKSNPSKHKCDARCTEAKGVKCECECGGKNHGRGSFVCEEAAS